MTIPVVRAPAATEVHSFEPLFPREARLQPLREQAHELLRSAYRLSGNGFVGMKPRLTPLLRAMSSYYTNKIEGQHTMPGDIQAALENNFSAEPDRARKQRLAKAHLLTEEWAEKSLASNGWRLTFDPQVLLQLHRNLYERLPIEDRVTDTDEPVNEGAFRMQTVRVGTHMAPAPQAVPIFMQRWSDCYRRQPDGENALIAIACSHHRLAWVHPFKDGNGRVARLHSHIALHAMGLTSGLWSPMRGLARQQDQYYGRLMDADEHRRGDFDGRGALTEEGLIAFASFFLGVCIDQVSFMESMLDLGRFQERLTALFAYEANQKGSGIRQETLRAVHYVAMIGETERGEFKRMTGLGERTAERALKALLDYGLLVSPTPKGKVHFGIPFKALRFLLPNLWPEAEASVR